MRFSSVYETIQQKTSNYTAVVGDDVIEVEASAGAVTITLYDPNGKYYEDVRDQGRVRVIKTDSSANPVTIATAAGAIKGQAVLRQQYQAADLISDGIATWYNFMPVQASFIAEVAISNAEIKALRATPKTLVPAQGAGTVIEFLGAEVILDAGTNALTETAANLVVKYNNGSGVAVSDVIECTGFIDQTADTATSAVPIKDAIVAKTGNENKALVLHNNGAGEYGGNAANDALLRVKVRYAVHNTGW